MSDITPFLWFDDRAEEAAEFYVSLFKNSKIESVSRYGEAGPGKPGSAMVVEFQLNGQDFMALNGGMPAGTDGQPPIALFANCDTQDEVDMLWDELSEGGSKHQCGWLTDKFGLSWQIIPDGLLDCINGDDQEGSQRAMEAMFQMKKLDINVLRKAYRGELTQPV